MTRQYRTAGLGRASRQFSPATMAYLRRRRKRRLAAGAAIAGNIRTTATGDRRVTATADVRITNQ